MSQHFVSAHCAPCPSEKYHSVVNVLTPKQPILIFDMFMFLSKPLNGNLIYLTSFCGNLGKSHLSSPLTVPPWGPARSRRIWKLERSAKLRWGKSQDALPWSPTSLVGSRQVFSKEHDAGWWVELSLQGWSREAAGDFLMMKFFLLQHGKRLCEFMWHVTFSIVLGIYFFEMFF